METWVVSHGGNCPDGTENLFTCTANVLDLQTRVVGVLHPGGASFGGVTHVKASFQAAADQIKEWLEADPAWLPSDEDGARQLDEPYVYSSAEIPFRDFAYGTTWRLGRGATSSNRKDSQRSIQLFSEGGKYNNKGDSLRYPTTAHGDAEGYSTEAEDLPYEPPKSKYRSYDKGPGKKFSKLMMGDRPIWLGQFSLLLD